MPYLLNLAYLLAIITAAPWLVYCALRKNKYRQGWPAKLLGQVPQRASRRPCVWWHAVSVGEVNLLPGLVAEWQRRFPQWEHVITTTTRTGYALAKERFGDFSVCYCPLDFSWAVHRALRRIRPDVLALAELELWPNLIRCARNNGVRVAVVNGRLSDKSYRGYRRIRWLIRRILRNIDLVAVQNEEYAQRFVDLGACPERVVVTGSLKFDGAEGDRNQPSVQRLRQLWGLTAAHRVLLAGSTQAPEESILIDLFRTTLAQHPEWQLILVPRHPERFDEVAELLQQSGLRWQRRSTLTRPTDAPKEPVLLVDCVGELGAWWGTADIGFVGGSLGQRGGQNMLEPAAYGVATCFGPNTWNFRDIVAMLDAAHASVVVHDQNELAAFVEHCVGDPDYARRLGTAAQQLVKQQQGVTQKTIDSLAQLHVQTAAEGSRSRDAA